MQKTLLVTALYDLYNFDQNELIGDDDISKSKIPMTLNYRLEQLRNLLQCHVNMLLFVDPNIVKYLPEIPEYCNVVQMPLTGIKTFSKIKALPNSVSVPDGANPFKDTRSYFGLINSKIDFVYLASQMLPQYTHYAWVDAGLSKVFTANLDAFRPNIERLINYPYENLIVAPTSSWQRMGPYEEVNAGSPFWRFLGGIIIFPKDKIDQFSALSKIILDNCISKYNKLTWEVNVWAVIEAKFPELFYTYTAEHNETMASIPEK
jgi:hypothetical protein